MEFEKDLDLLLWALHKLKAPRESCLNHQVHFILASLLTRKSGRKTNWMDLEVARWLVMEGRVVSFWWLFFFRVFMHKSKKNP